MKKSIATIFVLLFTLFIHSQSKRIESKLMDCYYQSFSDDGVELKHLISNYENLLINEGFLEDNSGNSYLRFLQNFANQKYSVNPSKLFSVEEQKIIKIDENEFPECRKIILADSTTLYNFKSKGISDAVINNAKPYNTVKDMLKVWSVDDFEIDYYKRQAFLVFLLIDTESGLKKINIEDLDIENALKMYLDSKNTFYLGEVEKTKEELKKIVRNHIQNNKYKYAISFKADRKSLYLEYIIYQNIILQEIHSLRQEYALEKYNTEYENLLEKQREEVNKTYPENFLTLD
ncbi:hypothetical protein N7U66_18875 [Lacinutrix neustonica]|uniref:Uncharacterized protein n=1 Tax=Lacinutrix neustonica TaxID=2980107 RepID=A0A9E8SDA7_9FLAO|nr:hypothetical protein [Lacinutrix neustonica]WAC01896.1 hypothetical protein N7U66_18875 [Lacinutrix neustonica]